MVPTWWLTYRFALPVAAALHMVITRWGHNNALFIIVVPILFLFFNMYLSSQEWPRQELLERYKPFRHARYKWHAADVASLVFLMIFEGGVAGMSAAKERSISGWCAMLGVSFVPYVLLSVVSRHYLRTAQGMVSHANGRIEQVWRESLAPIDLPNAPGDR